MKMIFAITIYLYRYDLVSSGGVCDNGGSGRDIAKGGSIGVC